MAKQVELSADCLRCLRKVVRRHVRAESIVLGVLDQIAANGPHPSHHRLARLGGRPIYKGRVSTGDSGKSGGARIIYACEEHRVIALQIYLKSDQETVADRSILDAFNNVKED